MDNVHEMYPSTVQMKSENIACFNFWSEYFFTTTWRNAERARSFANLIVLLAPDLDKLKLSSYAG